MRGKCINTSVCSLALNLIGIVLTKFSLLIIKIDVVCEAYYFVMYVCTYLVRDILEFLSSFEESFGAKKLMLHKLIYVLALGLDNTGLLPFRFVSPFPDGVLLYTVITKKS